MKSLGLILVMLGIVALAYTGVTYITRDKVIDIGSVQVTNDNRKTSSTIPIAGGLALVGGIVLFKIGRMKL